MSLGAVKSIGRVVVGTCVNTGARAVITASNTVDRMIASRPIYRLQVGRRRLRDKLFGLAPPRLRP